MTVKAMDAESHHDLVQALVHTYRDLNLRVRQLPEEKIAAGGENSVRAVVTRMRYDEMRFAQALKQRVTGVVVGEPDADDRLAPDAVDNDSTAEIISQFGTARETTLSLLGNLTDEEWSTRADDGKTLLDHARALVQSDQAQMAKIKTLLT